MWAQHCKFMFQKKEEFIRTGLTSLSGAIQLVWLPSVAQVDQIEEPASSLAARLHVNFLQQK